MPAPPTELSPRRRALLDAAQQVLADHGLRGLTHRAVDRRAGLPEGSCSAYLRTRKALLTALTEHVAAGLAADVDRLAHDLERLPRSTDETRDLEQQVAAISRLFQGWLDRPETLLARQELAVEAARSPEVAEVLEAARSGLVDLVAAILAARGRDRGTERAEWLVASLDGILLAALLKPPAERTGFLERALAQSLRSLELD